MALDDLRMALNAVVPQANGVIGRGRCDNVALGIYFHIVNMTFVSYESEWSHAWLEVPDHNGTICRSRHSLLEIWVKCDFAHCIFVPFE